jgi:hypothetical protein
MSIVIISEGVTSKVIITIVVVLKSDVCLNYHFHNNAQIETLELAQSASVSVPSQPFQPCVLQHSSLLGPFVSYKVHFLRDL